MRCPACDWTTVSYEMETHEWRCKRCRAVVTEGARSGRPLGASGQPLAPPRTPARSASGSARAAKGAAKPAAKPSVKKTSARPKARAGAKPARGGR